MRILLLLLQSATVLSLSAHSPPDLFASPQYQIIIGTDPILNETALSLLEESAGSPHDELHLLKTPSGQSFLCSIPSIIKPTQNKTKLNELEKEQAKLKGLERGLSLIEPLKSNCLYHRQGWFTYSFCYGTDIRQFHEIRLPGSLTSSEDPNTDSYTLGRFPTPRSIAAPKYGSGSATMGTQVIAELGGGDFGGAKEEIGLENVGGQYLAMKWDDGTVCDKTGTARSVDVQFHCNTQTTTRIHSIREVATCQYLLIIHTPRLCVEPVFLEGHEEEAESTEIECRPIVKRLRAAVDPPLDFLTTESEQLIFAETEEEILAFEKEPERSEVQAVGGEHIGLRFVDGEPVMEGIDLPEGEDGEYITFLIDTETGEIQSMDGVEIGLDPLVDAEDTVAVQDELTQLAKLMQQTIEAALSQQGETDPTENDPTRIPQDTLLETINKGVPPTTEESVKAKSRKAQTEAVARYLKKNQARLREFAGEGSHELLNRRIDHTKNQFNVQKEVGSKKVKDLVKLFSTKFEEEEEELVIRKRDEL